MPSLIDRQGRPQRVWGPRGIVIPWFIGVGAEAKIWKLYVRRPLTSAQREAGEKPYIQFPGGSNGLYNAQSITRCKPIMLVEGVFDALAVREEAGDLVVPVATGTTGARRAHWIVQLARAPVVLASYDADEAGERAARYWLDALAPHAVRWRPYWDDPAAMLQAHGDVRTWVETGLQRISMGG
ncbi:MAG: toprim domain-containing protein [Chloroflexales bacterium]|nr:toprim domain-containing protein [Chloroflexales bacterium]